MTTVAIAAPYKFTPMPGVHKATQSDAAHRWA